MSLAPRVLPPTSPGIRLLRACAGAGALAFALHSSPATADVTHGKDSPPAVAPVMQPTGAPVTHTIALSGYMFMPATMTVHVGDTVTWTNRDSTAHNVVAKSGASFKSPLISKGQSFSWTATSAGPVSYVCSLHPGMDAQLTVLPAVATTTTHATTTHASTDAARQVTTPTTTEHHTAVIAPSTTTGATTTSTAATTPAASPTAAAPSSGRTTLDPMLIVVAIVVATVVFCLLLLTGGGGRRTRATGAPDTLPPGWIVMSADEVGELQGVDGGRR